MRKVVLICMFVLLTVGIWGCSDKVETVSYDDLIDGKVDNGTEVSVTGKAAYFTEANKNNTELDIEGPTQIIKVVDENSKGFDVYNELDVTGEKIEKDDEVTIEGLYYNIGEDSNFAIQATEIVKN